LVFATHKKIDKITNQRRAGACSCRLFGSKFEFRQEQAPALQNKIQSRI